MRSGSPGATAHTGFDAMHVELQQLQQWVTTL
jgi:hypothetical protein